jgi:LmbE family N-acetylglucosaminyl deacetylase
MPAPAVSDRVLIVAPHPDDETLCCAGLILQAQRAGAAVAVVWLTDGDGFEIDAVVVERTLRPRGGGLLHLGAQRMSEAQAAAAVLGVPPENRYFLGYPDRGIARLLDADPDSLYRSGYTGATRVPYASALHPGTTYTGRNLRTDLGEVIATFRPTMVMVAAPQDRHSDHARSGGLSRELLAQRAPGARLYYWIVHAGREWPRPRYYSPQLPLLPPQTAAALDWQVLPLDSGQRALKLLALRAHRSQMEVMSPFLLGFVRANELFAPAR